MVVGIQCDLNSFISFYIHTYISIYPRNTLTLRQRWDGTLPNHHHSAGADADSPWKGIGNSPRLKQYFTGSHQVSVLAHSYTYIFRRASSLIELHDRISDQDGDIPTNNNNNKGNSLIWTELQCSRADPSLASMCLNGLI